jgi:hypothetical protein
VRESLNGLVDGLDLWALVRNGYLLSLTQNASHIDRN